MDNENNSYVNFGRQTVTRDEKRRLVGDLFSRVAIKYDEMNDFMSFGLHRLWKEELCKYITNVDFPIIDMASGTGDIAIAIAKKARQNNVKPSIYLCDPNSEMLKIAKNKALDKNLIEGLEYYNISAENIPFPDNKFSYYTIAFGIRNVADIDLSLKEAYRILCIGGVFLCLEFSHMENQICKKFYNFYNSNIIPFMGKIFAKNKQDYDYLAQSIKVFPKQEAFKEKIEQAGFRDVYYKNIMNGIASIHVGLK